MDSETRLKGERVMENGTVKWFNAQKGYGFITTEDDRDAFFHYSFLVMEGFKTIEEGADVEFDLVEGEDEKLQAYNIVKL